MAIGAALLMLFQAVGRAHADTPQCRADSESEIVVCGRSIDEGERYRVDPAPLEAPPPDGLRFRLLEGVETKVHAQYNSIGGWPDNQLRVTFKLDF